jgi:hypothetical protein
LQNRERNLIIKSMSQPLPNPYQHELPPEELVLGRPAAWALTVVFLALIAAPSFWQEFRELSRQQGWIPAVEFIRTVQGVDAPGQDIANRLRSYETSLEQHLEWAKPLRQWAQRQQTQWLAAGNHKAVLGKDGWMFYRPEIKALTGYGPLREEPKSVASDPNAATWQPPLEPILDFAAQLKSRGIELWLMPVPMKESIYPEMLGGKTNEPVVHPDQAALYGKFTANAVKIIELDQFLWKLKSKDSAEGPVYLRTDTHWAPRAMEGVVALLAGYLGKDPTLGSNSKRVLGTGDLMEKLDLGVEGATEEVQVLVPPPFTAKGTARITLLGDSFVNIYRDPGLGFGSGAGLAEQLMSAIGEPIEVIAINGGGATQVRQRLASKSPAELENTRIVIWVIAARDLFLGRAESQANQVIWENVKFPAKALMPNSLEQDFTQAEVTATVVEISPVGAGVNPQVTTYPNAIVAVKYRVDQVRSGSLSPREITVYQWLFKQRVWQPASKLKPGQQVPLKLLPWNEDREAYSSNQFDAFHDLERYWAE